MATRMCVFCGGGPLSNEHAWPDWLQEELLAPGSVRSLRWGGGAPLTRVDRKGLEVKVKRVCIPCNNRWMSGLEGQAKPVLLPLVRGQVNSLSYAEQQLVATWAVKTAMMLQFTPIHNAGTVIAPSLYQELYADQDRPPASVVVWIGHEAQQPPPGALFALRGMAIEHVDVSGLVPIRRPYLGFEATLIARHLVLKVMGHNGPGRISILNEVIAPAGLDLIWPVQRSRGILLPQSGSLRPPTTPPAGS